MQQYRLTAGLLAAFVACFVLIGCGKTELPAGTETDPDTFHVVSSFYPMHILAMNLTEGIEGVTESSMSDPNLGCIHDHTLTVDDLKKVEGADAYIENGLGMEVFNEKIANAYPDLPIIEASKTVTDEDVNLHIWTSIDYYIDQVKYVSRELQTLNPENQAAYAANEEVYVGKLEQLKTDYQDAIAQAAGKKVLVLDEALPNFCRFLNMDMVVIETDHEDEALSAENLKDTIRTMQEEGIRSIFIGKGADRSATETIAKETGAEIYELNTCMSGTDSDTADAYITGMQENLDIIAGIE